MRDVQNDPGRIWLCDLAIYLKVSTSTARRIAKEKELKTLGDYEKRPSYAWLDVWEITGVQEPRKVPPDQWNELMRPLLTADDAARILGLEQDTVRMRARQLPTAKGYIASIRLLREVVRFRRCDLDQQPRRVPPILK